MNSPVLNIAISLIFLYTLYSLLVTIINEIIATVFSSRGKLLNKAIERMLEEEPPHIWKYYFGTRLKRFWIRTRMWIYNIIPIGFIKPKKLTETITDDFFNHPAIKYLGEGKLYRRPSYISTDNFSGTLIEVLRQKGMLIRLKNALGDATDELSNTERAALLTLLSDKSVTATLENTPISIDDIKAVLNDAEKNIDAPIRKTLLSLLGNRVMMLGPSLDPMSDIRLALADANSDIPPETQRHLSSLLSIDGSVEKFQAELNTWFNEMMDRVTGWYKRQAKFRTFIVGLIVAVIFNVNTIEIVNRLGDDTDAANQLADLAQTYVEVNKDNPAFKKPCDSIQIDDSTKVPCPETITPAQESLHVKVDRLLDSANSLINGDIKQTNDLLGLGWEFNDSALTAECKKTGFLADERSRICKTCKQAGEIMKQTSARDWLGYIITALAISLGAPFWFDLLNKFVRLRGNGNDSEKKKATNAA